MLHSFKHLQYDLFVGLLDLPGFSKRRSKSHRRTVGWNFDGYFLVPGFGIFTAAASTVLDGLQVAGFNPFPFHFSYKKKMGLQVLPEEKAAGETQVPLQRMSWKLWDHLLWRKRQLMALIGFEGLESSADNLLGCWTVWKDFKIWLGSFGD